MHAGAAQHGHGGGSALARAAVLRTHLHAADGAAPVAAAAASPQDIGAQLEAMAMTSQGLLPPSGAGTVPRRKASGRFGWQGVTDFVSHMDKMEVTPDAAGVLERLPGPLRDTGRYPRGREQVILASLEREGAGQGHVLVTDLQRRYGDRGLASNIAVPIMSFSVKRPPVLTHQVYVADPGDSARIAREHVKKQPNYTVALLDSVLSTTDVASWRRQRQSLNEAFVPHASLARIFPVSRARAAVAADRLAEMAGPGGSRAVDISEFMLHEALAQLMLALFGFDDRFMERTNKPFRDAMAGRGSRIAFLQQFIPALLQGMKSGAHRAPAEAAAAGDPVRGPLSRLIDRTSRDDETMAKIGNAIIFAFAGHDTTGHTMTWLVFELARHPPVQRRLQAEVDRVVGELRAEGRELEYRDLPRLPFLTRCVMETLRLWPAVPNGTFRELEHDDWVTGEGGERVPLPKGTFVQIVNWARHRNPDLWGPDAGVFNPDREWRDGELWGGRGFSAMNPSSPRFSPFTFAPRDCIGRNFAQMEMRAIMCALVSRFDFELAGRSGAVDAEHYLGVNYATMGPQDLAAEPRQPPPRRGAGTPDGGRVPVGMFVYARPRRQ